jgi:hypothetical protein
MKINIQYNIGKAKYVVNYSDGTKQHPDGSEFFDIAVFKNKKKMDSFITSLQVR